MPKPAELATSPRARFATPEATVRTFVAALKGANLGIAMECFRDDSCFLTPDATAVVGRGAIGGVLAQLVAQRVEVCVEDHGALVAGDLAFVNQRWTMSFRAGGEDSYRQDVVPVLVMRRVRREWKLAIAAPWGRT